MSYEPKPGTTAFRAVAFLETLADGEEVMMARIAEASGGESGSMAAILQPALDSGLIVRRTKHGQARPFWYRLARKAPKTRIPEGRGSQHVVKAEAARPDATDRETPAIASPIGGSMGVGQSAAADPIGEPDLQAYIAAIDERHPDPEPQTGAKVGARAALWSSGEIAVEADDGTVIVFDAAKARDLVQFFARAAA